MYVYHVMPSKQIAVRTNSYASFEAAFQHFSFQEKAKEQAYLTIFYDRDFYAWDATVNKIHAIDAGMVHESILSRMANEKDPFLLNQIASSKSEDVLKLVASNEFAFPSTLRRLHGHVSTDVRIAIARNWTTSMQTLEALMEDSDKSVSSQARSSYKARSSAE